MGMQRVVAAVSLMVVLCLCGNTANCVWAAGPEEGFREKFNLPKDPEPVLEEILNRSEFKNQTSEPLFDWLIDRIWDLLVRALKAILSLLPRTEPIDFDNEIARMVFIGLSFGILGLIAVALVWTVISYVVSRTHSVVPKRMETPSKESDSVGSAQALLLARSMVERQNFAGALIYMFRYVLVWLDETGRLPIHPGRTNREILESISKDAPLRAPLSEMIPAFNSIKYGNAACTKNDYERFVTLCRSVIPGV